jgi:hypothetical protein
MKPPRLLAIAPPDWHADLGIFRRQLAHFAKVTADLGAGAAVYLRAHDRTLAQWLAWLATLQGTDLGIDLGIELGTVRVGISAPLGDALPDIVATREALIGQRIAFVHLPDHRAATHGLTWRSVVEDRLALSRPCHDPQDLGEPGYAWRLLSPVLPTPSKPGQPPLGLERLTEAVQQSRTPLLALGGIDALTAPAVLATGVAGIACLRAAWHDAEALVRACVADPRGSS